MTVSVRKVHLREWVDAEEGEPKWMEEEENVVRGEFGGGAGHLLCILRVNHRPLAPHPLLCSSN